MNNTNELQVCLNLDSDTEIPMGTEIIHISTKSPEVVIVETTVKHPEPNTVITKVFASKDSDFIVFELGLLSCNIYIPSLPSGEVYTVLPYNGFNQLLLANKDLQKHYDEITNKAVINTLIKNHNSNLAGLWSDQEVEVTGEVRNKLQHSFVKYDPSAILQHTAKGV